MSAFIVSDYQINAITNWAAQNDVQVYWNNSWVKVKDDPKKFSGALYSANVESVNYRYNDDQPLNGFKFKRFYVDLPAVQILKAIDCLEYQSCELKEWEQTFAFKALQSVKDRAISCLPGYGDAPWELSERKAA